MALLKSALALALTACAGCSSSSSVPSSAPSSPATPDGPDAAVAPEGPGAVDETDADLHPDLIKARPYASKTPSDYDGSVALPLVLALHGRGDTAAGFVKGSGMLGLVDETNVLVAYPDGEQILGASGWSVLPELGATIGAPDDVKYLRAVIADMASRYKVDRKRVVVVGLSMGAMMANVLACRASDKVAGILSISGSLLGDEPKKCAPKNPVSVILLNGTADETVKYDGGKFPLGPTTIPYVSAPELYQHWSDKNGCGAETKLAARDVDTQIAGAETTGVSRACRAGTSLTFLTMANGKHVPSISAAAFTTLLASIATKPRD
jgi:polyhydroxybutyrate depolymerase